MSETSETPASPAAPKARLLIAEDDPPLARLLSACLGTANFATELVFDGEEAQNRLAANQYDLLLLDLSLPKVDGFTLLAQLRASQPHLPVLVLTGRVGTSDLVHALNEGADDYLTKPFSVEELTARIRALLRRKGTVVPSLAAVAEQKPPQPSLVIDRDTYRVERNGRLIELTPREFDLLEFLMQNAPKPVSRSVLMEQVWRVPFDPSTNIVDVYMKYLRDKIDNGEEPKLIRTVRGVGYALAAS